MKRRLAFDALEDRSTPTTINVSSTAASGAGSLADAINFARTDATPSTINIVAPAAGGTISLGIAGSEFLFDNANTTNTSITINANGTTLQGGGFYRLFDVNRAALTLTLNNITITGGLALGDGGGVLLTAGTVNLNNSTLSGNNALIGSGGGLRQTGGFLSMTNVTFNQNVATFNGGGINLSTASSSYSGLVLTNNTATNGGGMYYDANGASPTLFFDANSTGNSATNGGLLAVDDGSFTVVATSVLAGNSATNGGGVAVGPTTPTTLTLSGATVRNNTASAAGGGAYVFNNSVLNVNNSMIGGATNASANSAPTGGGIWVDTFLSLNHATVANNSSSGNGAGVFVNNNNAAFVTIWDSTISSNSGTGLYVSNGFVQLINDTIAFNANNGVLVSAGTLFSGNTIFSNNAGLDYVGTIVTLGANMVGNASGVTGLTGADYPNTDPLLGPLGANGPVSFPSLTHALLPQSPALNKGINGNASGVGLTTDQRGSPRFVSTVDIGAYELVDTVSPTAAATPPSNINSSTAGFTTNIVTLTYTDTAGGGFESTSGVDFTTIDVNDITVSNGATVVGFNRVGNVVTYIIQSPNANWGVSPQGTYSINLIAGQVKDRAGNPIAGVAGITSFQVDTTPPTASLTTPPANVNAATGMNSGNTFVVTYNDSVSGINTGTIDNNDFIATIGGTTTSVLFVSRIGTVVTYSVQAPNGTWAQSPQGVYTIQLVAGSITDNAGNPIAGNNLFATFQVQTVPPFATLTTQPTNITVANASPGTNSFTITYSSLGAPLNPATYGPGNVSVTNGATTLMVISVSNNNNAVTYTVQAPGGMWTNPPQGQYTIALNGNSVFDTAGNPVPANPTLGFFTVDAYRPTPALTTPPATINTNYVGPQSNSFTITYSDVGLGVDPSTFSTANVTVMNGGTALTVNTAMVSGNAVTYTVLAPNNDWSTAPPGTYSIAIVANSVKDLAGNGIQANPNFAFFTVDLTKPTATLTTPPPNINIANSGPGTNSFTITYADTGSGLNPATFATTNVTVTNGSTTLPLDPIAVNGNAVTYTVHPAGGWSSVPAGTYTVALVANSVKDFAGNGVNGNSNLATFTVDVTAPTPTVSPTGTSTNASPIIFTINFTEPVTGLTTAGFTISNGTPGALMQVTTSQYTLPVTPTADGTVTVQVNAGAAQDTAGNPSVASNIASVFSDRTGPVATFSPPSAVSTTAGPVSYTITWTDASPFTVSLTPGQVILNATGTAGGTVSSVTGSGNSRTVTITDTFGNGTLSISLPPGVAVDSLGNPSAAAGPSTAFTVSGDRILNISQPTPPASILPGTTYVYPIMYSNTGNQIAPDARIVVDVPTAYGTFNSASSTPGWVNTSGSTYQFSLGNLAIGASGTVNFAVDYSASTPPGTKATFTASIYDRLSGSTPAASSSVSFLIVNPNRARWGRCC